MGVSISNYYCKHDLLTQSCFLRPYGSSGVCLSDPQPEAEAEPEAQRFYGNNYYSSNYGYPSYYRGYNSGYGNNGFYGNNYNNYNNYQGNSRFYNGNSGFW